MKFGYVLLILFFVVSIISCRDNIVDFNEGVKTGNLYIDSEPLGATIFFNETRTGKLTPDSLINLQPGNYEIRVTLLGVGEGTAFVDVKSGDKKYINIEIK